MAGHFNGTQGAIVEAPYRLIGEAQCKVMVVIQQGDNLPKVFILKLEEVGAI